ncbi:MAG: ATP-binding protein [Oscillospiraceae bacterium]|nr:ATP-binding protein [Oscillospiraceae bacterium]
MYLQTPIKAPFNKAVGAMVIINGSCYCTRIAKFSENTNVCEFFDVNTILALGAYTDTYKKIMPMMCSVEHNISDMWKVYLSYSSLGSENEDIVEELRKPLIYASSVVKSITEYIHLGLTSKNHEVIDAYLLAKGITDRCNSILTKCGRCVNFLTELDGFFILANHRHAINALVNSIQNAILYSPRDCVPTITLSKTSEDGKNFIVFQIINENIYFVNTEFGEKLDINFDFQRLGLGIPLIKRFAEDAGGSFYLREENGKVAVGVKIPEYQAPAGSPLVLEGSGYVYYSTGIPDIVEIKMLEAVYFFGNN